MKEAKKDEKKKFRAIEGEKFGRYLLGVSLTAGIAMWAYAMMVIAGVELPGL